MATLGANKTGLRRPLRASPASCRISAVFLRGVRAAQHRQQERHRPPITLAAGDSVSIQLDGTANLPACKAFSPEAGELKRCQWREPVTVRIAPSCGSFPVASARLFGERGGEAGDRDRCSHQCLSGRSRTFDTGV